MHWGPNVCRICGELGETCHLIFNKDTPSDLEAKLKKLLKLELFKDDCKPKQICNPCVIKLDDFNAFFMLCHNTNSKFDEIILSRSSDSSWSAEILDYTQQKMSVIVANKSIDQLGCNEIDLYKDCALNEHEMLEIVGNAGYTNLSENLDYLNSSYNIKKYHNDFYQETTVLRHSSTYQGQDSSSYCQNGDNSYNELNYNNVGIDYSNYSAKNNSDSFTNYEATPSAINNSSNSATAVAVKDNKRTFQCPHCDKKFKRRLTLNSHVAIHTKVRPYVCEICKKSYAIKCDLTNHLKVHTDKNKCKYCPSAFVAPSKLQRHLRIHTKDKPFTCDFKNCNKSFSDKRNLDGHKILHSDVFNFNCDNCSKVFRTKNRLKQHMKAHINNSESFTCNICSKSYKYKSTLVFHMNKHDGYICKYCGKDCEKPAKLIKHKKECAKRPQ